MSQALNIETLEHRVAADPGAPGFATLAEAYRRLGRLDDARRVAVAGLAVVPEDTQGRLALGLVLLDLGEAAAARYELERAMGGVAGPELESLAPSRDADLTFTSPQPVADDTEPAGLDDAEFDVAFASAQPVADEMLDATRIAQQAMRQQQLDEPEGFQVEQAPNFATATMAQLLDEQGDSGAADTIRGRLQRAGERAPLDAACVPDEEPFAGAPRATNGVHRVPQDHVVATLESWLANLGRGRS